MATFEFVIPLSIDALKEAATSRQYVVSCVYTAREISPRFQECTRAFRKDGPEFILDPNHFDTLYSILVNFSSIERELQMTVWDFINKVMTAICSKLSPMLEESDLCSNECQKWLLVLKMTTYVACQLTEAFENDHNKPSIETIGKKGKKGKKNELGVDWEEERNRMLIQLFSLLQASLHRLWVPPIMEEDYVNLIANCCYKILESNTINLVRTKTTRDSIFQIIGTLVKRFNHGLACSLKFMQLLLHFEHLVSPAAQGICLMIEQFHCKSVLQEMIREVVKIEAREMAKEASGLRNYSQFFIEVAEKMPHLFLPSLPLLVSFLEQEAYSMRICVLSILGVIVQKVLRGESLDLKSKTLRDECLDYLEEFIHDTNAFVRAKVLHVWEQLIESQAVPLTQQQPILKKVVHRLRDKSLMVRKNSLHLLSAFLKANPFAAKLPLEELQEEYEKELQTLKEFSPESSSGDGVISTNSSIYDSWISLAPQVIAAIKKLITEDVPSDAEMESGDEVEPATKTGPETETDLVPDLTPSLPGGFSLNDGITAVGEEIVNKNCEKALKTLQDVLDNFTDAEVLQFAPDEGNCGAPEELSDFSDGQKHHFLLLQRIFFCFLSMKQQKEMREGQANEEIRNQKKKDEEIAKQKMLCCYLKDCVNFAREIHSGLPDICQLLGSRSNTDVLEAVQFFVTAFEFGVLNAVTGVRRMLLLVWSKEPAIKEAVVQAYRRLYINIDAKNERARALHIVRNLTALITGASVGEVTSMEEIVSEFMSSGDIDKHCITLLWERFTKALPDTSDEESRASLLLLTMAANSQMNIISSNLNVLARVGLGERGEKDFSLVKVVCSALLKLGTIKPKTDSLTAPFRMEQNHEIFKRLRTLLVEGLPNLKDAAYSPMATEAITAIYLLAEQPDTICQEILQSLFDVIKNLSKDQGTQGDQETPMGVAVSMGVLSRFFVALGHVASRQLVHLDTFVFSELKRRNFLREEQKKAKRRSSSGRSKRKSLSLNKEADCDIDEEMGMAGAVADDAETDFIRNVCETETVSGDSFLAQFKPLIVGVCANPTKYGDPRLRAAASLALGKLMLVSSQCCDQNLPLLFTMLEKSTEPIIRANMIVVIGDLTVRFPNLVEPWTPRIYARLHDESLIVRRNTLTVLTSLILNDQVKVKGQISDIALCITDDEPRIAGLSKMFFNELSKKGNAIYNVLPDIISRLSDVEIGIQEDKFRQIISHIFGLIQKDRQLESFIEKLCHRIQATNDVRQWRDLTYCLSLLPYNEKGIRKLTENFACYADKLHDENVYEIITSILSSSKKLAKSEIKDVIEELEGRIEEAHRKGAEDENAAANAVKSKMKKRNAGSRKKSRKVSESSEEEEEEGEESEPLHPAHRDYKENVSPNIRTRRSSTRISKRQDPDPDSSEESDSDAFRKSPSKSATGRITRKRI